jgi:acyl-CoA synthetase (AMP-forming)/AMP-acid ligase II
LAHLASRVGNGLKHLGVERENRVALLLVDGPKLVASFYGAMAIGAVPVPLNTSFPPADYEFLLNHSRARDACLSDRTDPIAELANAGGRPGCRLAVLASH